MDQTTNQPLIELPYFLRQLPGMLKFKLIFTILIASFILLNTLNPTIYGFHGLMPNEFIIILFFIIFAFERRILISWVDKAFFIFFALSIIIPLILNYPTINPGAFGLLLPLKTWMVYRIALQLFRIGRQLNSTVDLIHIVLNIMIAVSAIAALIGILRYMKLANITAFINTTWPAKEIFLNPEQFGRLSSTMSGVNGTGIFFAAITILVWYMYQQKRNPIYLTLSIYFFFTMLLTGSFTAILCLSIACLISYRRILYSFLSAKNVIILTFSILLISYAAIQIKPLKNFMTNVAEKRMERQYGERVRPHQLIPYSLYGRAIRWPYQLSILSEKPIFGYGPDIPIKKLIFLSGSANTHNFYIFMLMQGGIVGFLAYLRFKFILLKKTMTIKYDKEKDTIVAVLFIFLFSQITSLTFQYGGISELYGIIMAFIFYLSVDSRKEYLEGNKAYSTC